MSAPTWGPDSDDLADAPAEQRPPGTRCPYCGTWTNEHRLIPDRGYSLCPELTRDEPGSAPSDGLAGDVRAWAENHKIDFNRVAKWKLVTMNGAGHDMLVLTVFMPPGWRDPKVDRVGLPPDETYDPRDRTHGAEFESYDR